MTNETVIVIPIGVVARNDMYATLDITSPDYIDITNTAAFMYSSIDPKSDFTKNFTISEFPS